MCNIFIYYYTFNNEYFNIKNDNFFQASIDLKPNHVYSAARTGRVKKSNGVDCRDITIDFESEDNCDIFLEKVGALRVTKGGLTTALISTKLANVPIAVFRKLSPEMKSLRHQAVERKKMLNFKHCWISQAGKLCMKKTDDSPVISISCAEDLLELK